MTAMQELLVHFNELNESGWFTFDEVEQAILDFGVPAEKEQLIDAFDDGQANWEVGVRDFETGKQYYNEVYENKSAATPAT